MWSLRRMPAGRPAGVPAITAIPEKPADSIGSPHP
jgi:hypothetical protein